MIRRILAWRPDIDLRDVIVFGSVAMIGNGIAALSPPAAWVAEAWRDRDQERVGRCESLGPCNGTPRAKIFVGFLIRSQGFGRRHFYQKRFL